MGSKQCEQCSEMVDEAKAFCPGCGYAFVEEEKREKSSEFESLDSTVQLGQTMYNQMLSDMGLNISKAPNPVEKKVPDVPTPVPVQKRVEVIVPAAAPASVKQPVKPVGQPVTASNKKWFILGGVVLILGFFIFAAAAITIVFLYRSGFKF